MNSKKLFQNLSLSILLGCVVFLCGCSSSTTAKYESTVEDSSYIMHALGGIDEKFSYTNSIDALKQCYSEGYRLYEVDVALTTDKKLVLAHSSSGVWTKKDWETRIGLPYDEDNPCPTYDEFMSFKIQGQFKASSFSNLVDFMETHTDVYVMIDIGSQSYENTKEIYQEILDVANKNDDILCRFIVGGHTTDMIAAVQEVYDFPLINLYYADVDHRPVEFDTPTNFIKYCKENNITSFSTSSTTASNEDISLLLESELISYVFTVNDVSEACRFFEMGVDVVGTDFLR